MRAICLVHLDKARPALILTRAHMIDMLLRITIAPITSTIAGIPSEVRVGPRNGLDHDSVVSCDNVLTVRRDSVARTIGYLLPDQEHELTRALAAAYGLELPA